MARIAGVDLPRNKRVEVGLTYIYGIGLPTSQKILAQARVNPDTRIKDLTEAEVNVLREMVEKQHIGGRRSAPRGVAEHQASHGNRRVSRPASSPQPADARTALAHQCPHPQRDQEDGSWTRPPPWCEEEVSVIGETGFLPRSVVQQGAAPEIRFLWTIAGLT